MLLQLHFFVFLKTASDWKLNKLKHNINRTVYTSADIVILLTSQQLLTVFFPVSLCICHYVLAMSLLSCAVHNGDVNVYYAFAWLCTYVVVMSQAWTKFKGAFLQGLSLCQLFLVTLWKVKSRIYKLKMVQCTQTSSKCRWLRQLICYQNGLLDWVVG